MPTRKGRFREKVMRPRKKVRPPVVGGPLVPNPGNVVAGLARASAGDPVRGPSMMARVSGEVAKNLSPVVNRFLPSPSVRVQEMPKRKKKVGNRKGLI